MAAIHSMTDDVTTAAEAMARHRATREKFYPSANVAESMNLRTRLEETRRRVSDLEHENIALRARASTAEAALEKASRGEASIPDIVRIADVQKAICEAFRVTRNLMVQSSRTYDLVRMRHIGFTLCKELCFQSLPTIGREFGGMDHTSVLNGVRKGAPVWLIVRGQITGKTLVEIVRLMDRAWDAHWNPIRAEKYRQVQENRKRVAHDKSSVFRPIGDAAASVVANLESNMKAAEGQGND